MSRETYTVIVSGGWLKGSMQFDGYTAEDIETDRKNGFDVEIVKRTVTFGVNEPVR